MHSKISRPRSRYTRSRYTPLACLCLLPLVLLIIIATQAHSPHNNIQERATEANPGEICDFEGDSDTYGLGIRLGIYLQWVTFTIILAFVEGEARQIRGVSNCFQGAMFVALIFMTTRKGRDLYAIEAYVVLFFCFFGIAIEVVIIDIYTLLQEVDTVSGTGERKTKNKLRPGLLIQICLLMAINTYLTWFAFKGMDGMKHPQCTTNIGWPFRFSLYGWFRTVMKVLMVIGTAMMGLSLVCFVIIWILLSCASTTATEPGGQRGAEGKDIEGIQRSLVRRATLAQPALSEQVKTYTRRTAAFTIGALRLMLISGVEFTIKRNHIQGVNQIGSTGQLIPLLVGLGGLLSALYRLYEKLAQAVATTVDHPPAAEVPVEVPVEVPTEVTAEERNGVVASDEIKEIGQRSV